MLKILLDKYKIKHITATTQTARVKSIIIKDIKTIIKLKEEMEKENINTIKEIIKNIKGGNI